MYSDFDILNKENFLMYAMKVYDNPGCQSVEEFSEDLNMIKYIKRLFNRYEKTGEIKERLVLNHMITLCNVFGNYPSVRMMFFKIDKKYYSILKTFCIYLSIMPDIVYGINGISILNTDIPVDMKIANILREF